MDNPSLEKRSRKFFVFPLQLIYPLEDYRKTLNRIISYCMQSVGRKLEESLDEMVINDIILPCAEMPDDYDEEKESQRHVVIGGDRLGVRYSSVLKILSEAKEADTIISTAERVNGDSALAFIGAQLLWDCLAGRLSYREFTVICAVNSVLGKDGKPRLVRRSLLLARAAGFKTPDQYGKGCTPHFKARLQLTVDELRWTLEKLEKRDLFARVQASPRRVYFSKGPREKLLEYVIALVKKQTVNKIAKRRSEEHELMRNARLEAGKQEPGNCPF